MTTFRTVGLAAAISILAATALAQTSTGPGRAGAAPGAEGAVRGSGETPGGPLGVTQGQAGTEGRTGPGADTDSQAPEPIPGRIEERDRPWGGSIAPR